MVSFRTSLILRGSRHMTTTAVTTPPKPRRRWLQFSLRTLRIVVLAYSVRFAWFAERMNDA